MDVGDGKARRHDAEPVVLDRQLAQQRGDGGVLHASGLGAGRVLEGLQPVEDEQRPLRPHETRQEDAAFPRRAGDLAIVSEPFEGEVDEGVGAGGCGVGALAVEGPAEDAFGAAPGVGGEGFEPVVDQGRLAYAAEGDQDEDAGGVVREGFVELVELGFASQEVLAGDGEAGYGDGVARRYLRKIDTTLLGTVIDV